MSSKEIPQITNQKIIIKSIECSMPPAGQEYMMCEFTDENGITKEIQNVAFYNFDAFTPKFGTHRDLDTGEMVITAESDRPIVCEIMGENSRGITVNCYEAGSI